MPFDIIAFDADDTLWHNEIYYRRAQDALVNLLSSYDVTPDAALDVMHRIDVANIPDFGYGIKGFTLSMIEAAIEATEGRISGTDIQFIVDLGRSMVRNTISLLEHSAQVVEQLAQQYELMVITKGDLRDQERKLAGSGLARSFRYVEIVSDKNPEVYATLLQRHQVPPQHFVMIGNSMRSDILPVLEIGGHAIYVPFELTWAHEDSPPPEVAHGRFHEIAHLGQLPDLLNQIG